VVVEVQEDVRLVLLVLVQKEIAEDLVEVVVKQLIQVVLLAKV
jgi:hypothetical protein